jgi:hypothetical protein
MVVMARGDIVVGNKPSARKQAKPQGVIVDKLPKPAGAAAEREGSTRGNVGPHCGAMSQQRCDSGATSTPQQFVHLVGCRDRKTGQQQG